MLTSWVSLHPFFLVPSLNQLLCHLLYWLNFSSSSLQLSTLLCRFSFTLLWSFLSFIYHFFYFNLEILWFFLSQSSFYVVLPECNNLLSVCCKSILWSSIQIQIYSFSLLLLKFFSFLINQVITSSLLKFCNFIIHFIFSNHSSIICTFWDKTWHFSNPKIWRSTCKCHERSCLHTIYGYQRGPII